MNSMQELDTIDVERTMESFWHEVVYTRQLELEAIGRLCRVSERFTAGL